MKQLSLCFSKAIIHGLDIFLTTLAVYFSNMQCRGHTYEPKVPKALLK